MGFWRNPGTDYTWFDSETNWNAGYIAIGIIVLIFVLNFASIIVVTIKRVKLHLLKYKLKKSAKDVVRQKKKKSIARSPSIILDAVDAIGGAILDVIDEDEQESYESE